MPILHVSVMSSNFYFLHDDLSECFSSKLESAVRDVVNLVGNNSID